MVTLELRYDHEANFIEDLLTFDFVQVAAASFNKGKLSMLASSFAKSGGRNFDEEMCKHFAAEFAERFAEI